MYEKYSHIFLNMYEKLSYAGSALCKLGRVDWQAQIKFSPAFSLMERQIGLIFQITSMSSY